MSTRYALMVKSISGRKWFLADSAQTGDLAMAKQWMYDAMDKYSHHGLTFRVGTGYMLDAPIAPKKYRPWDNS